MAKFNINREVEKAEQKIARVRGGLVAKITRYVEEKAANIERLKSTREELVKQERYEEAEKELAEQELSKLQ